MEKFILLTANQEPNIGVIKIDTSKMTPLESITEGEFASEIREKLIKPLEEHFDADVKINSVEIKSLSPISVIANVIIDSGNELDVFSLKIELAETWVY